MWSKSFQGVGIRYCIRFCGRKREPAEETFGSLFWITGIVGFEIGGWILRVKSASFAFEWCSTVFIYTVFVEDSWEVPLLERLSGAYITEHLCGEFPFSRESHWGNSLKPKWPRIRLVNTRESRSWTLLGALRIISNEVFNAVKGHITYSRVEQEAFKIM